MKEIVFIADMFKEQLPGGGESNDFVLIQHLQSQGYVVNKVLCHNVDDNLISSHQTFIIGNFIQLSEEYKHKLRKKKYIIYEHDHKYLKSRDPSVYTNFIAPIHELVNEAFFKNAHAVVVLSNICEEIIKANLQLDNLYNIGCSLWTDEKLNYIKMLSDTEKSKEYAILRSPNPVKGFSQAIDFCSKNNIQFDIIEPCEAKSLLTKLAQYKVLVFFPQVLETFCRLATEAKMLNCKLLTKKKMLGFASEDCFKLQGKELINDITQRRNRAYELFTSLIRD